MPILSIMQPVKRLTMQSKSILNTRRHQLHQNHRYQHQHHPHNEYHITGMTIEIIKRLTWQYSPCQSQFSAQDVTEWDDNSRKEILSRRKAEWCLTALKFILNQSSLLFLFAIAFTLQFCQISWKSIWGQKLIWAANETIPPNFLHFLHILRPQKVNWSRFPGVSSFHLMFVTEYM